MPIVETDTRKIIARLQREGWVGTGGAKHDKFEHPSLPRALIIVPRHRVQSIGVALSIAKIAGWL
jgi:predicted RNA binding protein YcfA (HicA-like mRNA interferase family)